VKSILKAHDSSTQVHASFASIAYLAFFFPFSSPVTKFSLFQPTGSI
jgi:hypothetical protein